MKNQLDNRFKPQQSDCYILKHHFLCDDTVQWSEVFFVISILQDLELLVVEYYNHSPIRRKSNNQRLLQGRSGRGTLPFRICRFFYRKISKDQYQYYKRNDTERLQGIQKDENL